jgi:hypothetical protein
MSHEGFFRRWSRLKTQGGAEEVQPEAGQALVIELPPVAQTTPHPPVEPAPLEESPRALPTLDDVARLDANSDFSAFVTNGVDKAVQRLAMKKLFSDPHFNIMDGLDIYIDDYTKADPIPAAMLASLQHTRSLFPRTADDGPPLAANGVEAHRRSEEGEPAGVEESGDTDALPPDEAPTDTPAPDGEESDATGVPMPREAPSNRKTPEGPASSSPSQDV